MARSLFSVLVLVFAFHGSLCAQATTASVVGVVLDPQGRVVGQAEVVADHLDRAVSRRTSSNASGAFSLGGLAVGRYRIVVSKAGFSLHELEEVDLHVGQELRLDVRLYLPEHQEQIQVAGSSPGLEAVVSMTSRAVRQGELENLPLNGRQLQNLALLAPGVAAGWNWSTAANRYGKARENLEGAFTVNGARGRSNNFTLDGVPLNLRQYGAINFEPSVEAVQEFRLVTGTPPAEYGSTMGSTVNIVTRSGGERLHGAVYEFFRNDRLDANDPFNKSSGLPRGKLRQNQFGGSVGGPLFGRSNFFFVNTELLRIVEGVETRLVSVPTVEEARGLLQVLDAGGQHREIDLSSRIAPPSRKLVALYPAPNRPGVGELNYSSSLLIRLNDYQTHARTDHYLSARDLLNVRFSWNLNDQEYIINRFGGPFIPGFSLPNPEKTINGGISYSRSLGVSVLSELRFGVNRYRNPLANGDTRGAEQIGIPNGSVAIGIPFIEFRGGNLESLGGQPWMNRDQNETTYHASETLSALLGRHSLKFGFSMTRRHFNSRGAFNQRGTIRFDGSRNQIVPRIPGNERASLLADFLLGLPSEAAITVGQFGRGFRQWSWAGFTQDSWRLTQRLTLNLGVRYEYSAPWSEVNGKLSNLTPGRGLVTGSDPAFRGLYSPDRNNFGPRVGFALDSDGSGRTVVRGGFGILYETLLQANSVELIENNAPFASLAITRSPTPFSAAGPSTTLLDLAALARPSRSLGAVGSFRNPYTMQFTLGIQRQLPGAWFVELGYSGTRGLRLPVYRNGNQVPLEALTDRQRLEIGRAAGAGRDTTPLLQPLRPNVDFDNVTLSENIGSSTYHSGQVRLSRRLRNGFLVDASYTFSRSIDTASDFNSADPSEQVLNSSDLRSQRALSSFDITHRVTGSLQYDLPGPRDKRGAWALLQGWSVNALVTLQSGQPFTPFITRFDPYRNEAFNRPNVVGDPRNNVPPGLAFAPAAFAVPPLGEFGNAGRNIIRGDSYRTADLSLVRTIHLDTGRLLQFRAEAMNLLNTVNFQGPVTDLTAAPGAYIAAAPPRVVQLGLKFEF